jgi:hypothetical protein
MEGYLLVLRLPLEVIGAGGAMSSCRWPRVPPPRCPPVPRFWGRPVGEFSRGRAWRSSRIRVPFFKMRLGLSKRPWTYSSGILLVIFEDFTPFLKI